MKVFLLGTLWLKYKSECRLFHTYQFADDESQRFNSLHLYIMLAKDGLHITSSKQTFVLAYISSCSIRFVVQLISNVEQMMRDLDCVDEMQRNLRLWDEAYGEDCG